MCCNNIDQLTKCQDVLTACLTASNGPGLLTFSLEKQAPNVSSIVASYISKTSHLPFIILLDFVKPETIEHINYLLASRR